MHKEILIIIIVIVCLSYYVDETFINSEVTMVVSNIDGRRYIVRNLPDKQQAADMLARLNESAFKIIKHLQEKYPNDERVQLLQQNFDPDALSEGTDSNKYTSYTINKNSIVMCLRQKNTNSILDFNTLLYPYLHEKSHLLTRELNHTKQFWKNFRWFLQEAVDIGIYTPIDYSKTPVKYCGIEITSNILNDPTYDEKKDESNEEDKYD